jgi:K+-sensing histidine kinase KdpD
VRRISRQYILRVVLQTLLGGVALAVLTMVCFQSGFNVATTMCLYLILIVLLSVWGSFVASMVVSLIAVGFLIYYFAPPLFSFRINDPFEGTIAVTFLIVSAGMSRFASAIRQSK